MNSVITMAHGSWQNNKTPLNSCPDSLPRLGIIYFWLLFSPHKGPTSQTPLQWGATTPLNHSRLISSSIRFSYQVGRRESSHSPKKHKFNDTNYSDKNKLILPAIAMLRTHILEGYSEHIPCTHTPANFAEHHIIVSLSSSRCFQELWTVSAQFGNLIYPNPSVPIDELVL